MNKQRFVQILADQGIIEMEDLQEIEYLEKTYPYSQVLHTLSAIGSYRNKAKNTQHKLNIAAVYSTDRAVLKDSVLSVESKRKVAVPVRKTAGTKGTDTSGKSASGALVVDQPSGHPGHLSAKEAEHLRMEVIRNLENLKLIKSNFMKDYQIEGVVEEKKKPKKNKKKKNLKKDKKKILVGIPSPNSELAESPSELKQIPKEEQIEIIERFIKEEPVLQRSKNEAEKGPQSDLSLQSVEFGQDLVSENLAKILLKQGKKKKAIDIYKKLIWKYPQKKAYFASQIEGIKEK